MNSIKLFESKNIRSVWNEAEERWYFSVHDIVLVLTDSTDVKQYVKRILSRESSLKLKWGTICTLVEMKAADGKNRKILAANSQGKKRKKNYNIKIKINDNATQKKQNLH